MGTYVMNHFWEAYRGGCLDITEKSFILAECMVEAFYLNIVLLKPVITLNLVFTKKINHL